MTVTDLPAINATLNATAAAFLLGGWFAIKRGHNMPLHRALMCAALAASALFLSCYLYYHAHTGSTPYTGQGALRTVYFFILFTHIPLAGLMVPFILAAVCFAFRGQYQRHKRIVRWLWPVWMYVSITGVLIYIMLYKI